MIREKIFRLHRHTKSSFSSSSSSSLPTDAAFAHKFGFSFSNIQAFQVPKGWDKLMLSLVSSESGKMVRKSGKVQVKNGTCQWAEPLSESIWISDFNSSKELDEYLCKFIISMGSSRSGILGETTLNLGAFLNAESPVMVSLPLNNCSCGTILQFEVRCLTPRTELSDERWRRMIGLKEENPDEPDKASQVESCNSNIRETSFAPAVSRYSFESTDDSLGRRSSSSQSDQNGTNNVMTRQDSVESSDSGSHTSYSTHGSVKSVRSVQGPFTREKPARNQRQSCGELAHTNFLSLEQELEAEARMWERNARKLSLDLEALRKELSDQNLMVTNLNIELAASRSDCQKLTQEIECLKSEIRETGNSNIQKEMEDELRFLKEQNENLSMLLNKTQESNIKLISLLQEMEVETAAKQNLAQLNSKNNHMRHEDSDEAAFVDQVSASQVEILHESESGASISEMSITNICEGIPLQNNFSLELELLNLRNSQQTFQHKVLVLESTLEDEIIATEIEQDLKNHVVKSCLIECSSKLDDKEQQIMNLEAALSRALINENLKESEHKDPVDDNEEIELSAVQTQELEKDCNEPGKISKDDEPTSDIQCTRNETLEYDSTVPQSNADSLEKEKSPGYCPESIERDCTISTSDCFSHSVSDRVLYSSSSTSSHISDNIEEIRLLEAENINTQWEKHVTELEEENIYLSQRVSGLEAQLRYLVDTKESSRLEFQHSEYQVMILQDQIRRLKEEIELQKLDMKQKLQGMDEQWSEAREECESLGKVNAKLQDTAETLAGEYSLLQKLIAELKERKKRLEERCVFLETEARKCQDVRCSCSESISKPVIDELELKLKDCELGRLQLDEENRVLRMQLQRVPELQNEVLGLRVSLKEMESQTLLLKASLNSVSEDYEELKQERVSMVQEISCLSEAFSEVEDCRRKRTALEEKILRLEGDLIAMDQLCAQDVEMRHELSRTKILNNQLTMKVKHLEEVRDHLQSKLLSYEDGLKQTWCAEERRRKSTSKCRSSPAMDVDEDIVPEDQRKLCIHPSQSNGYPKTKDSRGQIPQKAGALDRRDGHFTRSEVPEADYETKVRLLGNQFGEVLETNDIYKLQLKSAQVDVSKESEAKESADTGKAEHKISMLEAELQEICQRYLQMSLKYAEVEAQREQLVMKLKALNSNSSFSPR